MPDSHDSHRGHVDLVTEAARDALHVRRAFGEPVRHGSVTIVPVARVRGGNGIGFGSGSLGRTGEGTGGDGGGGGRGDGGGGGFGVMVRPLGVFVVSEDDAKWRPTVDVNRVILGGQVVGGVAVLAVTHVLRHRATVHARAATAATSTPLRYPRLLRLPRLPLPLPHPHLVRRATIGTIGLVSDVVRRALGRS